MSDCHYCVSDCPGTFCLAEAERVLMPKASGENGFEWFPPLPHCDKYQSGHAPKITYSCGSCHKEYQDQDEYANPAHEHLVAGRRGRLMMECDNCDEMAEIIVTVDGVESFIEKRR